MTLKEEERIRILNLLVWLQVATYAADEASTIKWFNRNQTKMLLNRLNDTIQKEHKDGISGLWEKEGVNMEMIMSQVLQFSQLISDIPFYMLPEIKQVIEKYLDEQIEANKKKP
jgi:hypothetical protein